MRKALAILIITVMMLMVGCEQEQKQQPTESPYEGGSQGIVAGFEPFGVKEDGIASIYENEKFPVEITLKNKGEEKVGAGEVIITLKGISPNDYTGIVFEATNEEELEAISEFNPHGGEETVDFGDAEYSVDLKGSYYDATFFASYRYPYATHVAVPRVCFNTEPEDETVCKLEGKKEAFSSGAPIQVKNVKETRAGANIIAVEFEVENVGGGQVTTPGEDFDTRYGKILFSLDDTSDPQAWECKMGGEENQGRLVDGRGTIRCKLKEPMEEDTMYTKQLDISVEYDYKHIIEQSVRIKKKA